MSVSDHPIPKSGHLWEKADAGSITYGWHFSCVIHGMTGLATDLNYAFRLMRRSPGFSALAIVSLALGIAANMVIFSVVNGLLLRPLPFPHPENLYSLFEVVPREANLYPELPLNPNHADHWKKTVPAIAELGLLQPSYEVVGGAPGAVRVPAASVTPDFLRALEVKPLLGRLVEPSDAQPGRDHVAVLTYSLWKGQFGGRKNIIGQPIRIEGISYTVIGVMPKGFYLPDSGPFFIHEEAELFQPLVVDLNNSNLTGNFNYDAIVRLKSGVSREKALAELNASLAAYAKTFPDKIVVHAGLIPLSDYGVKNHRLALIVLLSAVGVVLLVVCLNLATLMLAKAELRRQEMAIRAAMGAGRGRLIRQSLTEACLYAGVGGGAGLWLATATLKPLLFFAPDTLPRQNEVFIDGRVVLFALGVTVLTALVFGVYPAWQQSRSDPQTTLGAVTRSSTLSRAGIRSRGVLIAAEVGLSTALLVMAGALIHSFVKLMNVNTGVDTRHGISAEIALPEGQYKSLQASTSFYKQLITKLQEKPGVEVAGLISQLPLSGETWMDGVSRPGDTEPRSQRPTVNVRFISPSYFAAMRIPIESGRTFQEQGRERKNAVVISAVVARRLWPHENPIGQTLLFDDRPTVVVGVAADTRADIDRSAPPVAYVPYWSDVLGTDSDLTVVIRSGLPPSQLADALRRTVDSIDAGVPVSKVRSLSKLKSDALANQRFQTTLVGVFAGTTLLVAALGIFGVIASIVTARRKEIGIRMALGATVPGVVQMVLRQGMIPVTFGMITGLITAISCESLMQSLLYEVSPADPVTLVCVVVVLATAAAFACWVPARRAARIDPMEALRYE